MLSANLMNSDDKPALQNIPVRTELGPKVHEALTSKEPLADVDFSELEQRMATEIAKAEEIENFVRNVGRKKR